MYLFEGWIFHNNVKTLSRECHINTYIINLYIIKLGIEFVKTKQFIYLFNIFLNISLLINTYLIMQTCKTL